MCIRKPHANLAIGTFYAKMTIETLVWYLITEQRQCSQCLVIMFIKLDLKTVTIST